MMAKVKIQMYLDVSRCILMYMNGTHQDTCEIHARYMRDTWDTYPDNKPPPNSITNPTSPLTPTPHLIARHNPAQQIEQRAAGFIPVHAVERRGRPLLVRRSTCLNRGSVSCVNVKTTSRELSTRLRSSRRYASKWRTPS